TGSVYLPKTSANARYVFSIQSEIVNTFATCKTPDNYSPLVWLDASDTTTLKKTGTTVTTVNPLTSFGSASNSTRDTLEERADNGSQTTNSWQSNDFEMHTCDSSEFSNSICTTNSSKYLNIGMIYSNVNVPQGSTITNATLTLACANPAGTSGSSTHQIYGIYKSASNLHPDLFTSIGTNQLKTPLATASLHTSASTTVSENNCPPGNNTTYDVTPVVQEIISNANWNPSTSGGRLGLAIQRTAGSGSRHLDKDGNQLSISYSTATVVQANNTDGLGIWLDKSGNGNNAAFTYGTAPTRQDNQINAKTIVRFNNGAFLSALTNALSAKRELTAFAVIKPNYSTSSSDGRIISGTTSSVNNDTTSGSSIIPLLRNGSGSGFSSIYSGSSSAYRTNYSCSSCANIANVFASSFAIHDSSKVDNFLYSNGTQVAETDNFQPTGNPYTFGINQLYFGGTRTGAMPGSGTSYFNGDYAELIVYDHALSCHQTVSIENYLRSKWGLAASAYADSCPDDIPTL
ncbi:MAG TPA: hypothetical protein VK534_01615, partial [Methylomirabilota bacterium]|nr:hypothetical protein [Methylomirabilota bacterium]